MSLTSVGYTGTVDAIQDAKRSQYQGAALPVVGSRGSFAPSINSGAIRTVDVAAGIAFAHGVQTTSDAVESVQFDAATTSGSKRWSALVLRRNWGASTAVLTKVEGVASATPPMVLPSGVNNSPGVLHDQVVALVQITNGLTVPTGIVDMRAWSSKVFSVRSLTALPAPVTGLYGTEAEVEGVGRYRCVVDGSGNYAWLAA